MFIPYFLLFFFVFACSARQHDSTGSWSQLSDMSTENEKKLTKKENIVKKIKKKRI